MIMSRYRWHGCIMVALVNRQQPSPNAISCFRSLDIDATQEVPRMVGGLDMVTSRPHSHLISPLSAHRSTHRSNGFPVRSAASSRNRRGNKI
ncbi:Hypothetical protein NTJ_10707 [Nesidiocoris tenuis]|uniref:Uncharacterized protein n=1 Tax=Nesidiocoris tenuis TaxID=355587 RepID=A0ABN7B0Y5_9HEMI|nr:Hypothetical protein NTJ_10707 [Nesidiocoris tenuis]